MKIEPRQIESFLKKPDPRIRGVVIYGNDDGLVADLGTLQRLPHLMPSGLVRELAYSGRRLLAEEAARLALAYGFGPAGLEGDRPVGAREGFIEAAKTFEPGEEGVEGPRPRRRRRRRRRRPFRPAT